MSYKNPWLYDGVVFESENIEDYFGFCYLLTDLENGKMYIGRKYFYQNRKKKVREKEYDLKVIGKPITVHLKKFNI